MSDSSATDKPLKLAADTAGETTEELLASKWLLFVFMDLCEQLADECGADLADSFINIRANTNVSSRVLTKISVRDAIDRVRAESPHLSAKGEATHEIC